MSKTSRGNSRKTPRAARPQVIRTVADLDAAGGRDFTPDMPCRATYLTDPVLGGLQPATVDRTGHLTADTSGTTEPVPAVLFEPTQALMMKNTVTGMLQEARTEGIIAAGFARIPDLPAWAVHPAPCWQLRRVPGGLILQDSTGDIWARSQITLEPVWVSAATSYRHVAVFYGPKLGVRTPPGTRPAAYTTARRAAEFRDGRRQGLACAATIPWHGEPVRETLDWVTFLPGSFGQPRAGLFAPLVTFTMHGGPALFGLTPAGPGTALPIEPIPTLTAHISRTDIDLTDGTGTAILGQLGGVHYPEGLPHAWRQAARHHGQLLLITGHRLPGYGPPTPGEAPGELWAAYIPLQAD